MSTDLCVFVIRRSGRAVDGELERKAERLASFYGLESVELASLARGGVTVGRLSDRAAGLAAPLRWGEPSPGQDPTPEEVLGADPQRLLELTKVGTIGTLVAWGSDRARLVTVPSGLTSLYEARGPDGDAWATHAVAAALLAGLVPSIDWGALPELLAFDFVGGDRTLLAGVRSVDLATCIDVTPARATTTSFLPAPERWSGVSEDEAFDHTTRSLLRTLEVRTDAGAAHLMLTAGADSRVLAVALAELGRTAQATTWGDPAWPEVRGAQRVASQLGMRLRPALSWRSDGEAVREFELEARWSDGVLPLGLGRRVWPHDAASVVLGTGGELGRAFYFRRVAGRRPPPRTIEETAAVLEPHNRLGAASAEASSSVREAARGWASAAVEAGHHGWGALDAIYAEQRIKRWARGHVPPLQPAFIAGFAPLDVARGLMAQPLEARLGDGFHRRFVSEHAPALVPAPPGRRGAARAMSDRLARRLGRRTVDHDALARWAERPVTRGWLVEHAVRHPSVVDVLGSSWAERVARAFAAGDVRAGEQAALVAGPVALQDSLRVFATP